jgi:hypothetical protein
MYYDNDFDETMAAWIVGRRRWDWGVRQRQTYTRRQRP